MNNCTFPWTGMVIDPQGYITLCCLIEGKKRIFNKHISQVDNIIDFFNGKQYNDIRVEFKEKTFQNIPECHYCKKTINDGRFCPAISSQQFDLSINKLQYLEFNTSNVCNQQCVTCSSKFSNQWIKINPFFDRHYKDTTYILTDKDINKICDALTNLKELQIKGGEPFADIRNYKIIKKLFEVNDECMIQIITNGSLIPEKYMDLIFRNPKRFWISASIDAVGKRYEWIRSTPWEKTNQTLKELYYQTGVKPRILPILSCYNINSTTSLDNWASESEWINIESTKIGGYYQNLVHGPDWCNPKKVFTQKQINTIKDLPFPIKSEYNKYAFERHIKYTEVMNKVRGFEIDIWNDME